MRSILALVAVSPSKMISSSTSRFPLDPDKINTANSNSCGNDSYHGAGDYTRRSLCCLDFSFAQKH
jgi:hypothetical protein